MREKTTHRQGQRVPANLGDAANPTLGHRPGPGTKGHGAGLSAGVVLARFRRGRGERTEELRVVLDEYKGRKVLHLRIWWQTDEKGVTVRRGELEELVAAFRQAYRELP